MRAPVVAVVGLGYVGLPLALRAAECGMTVVGIDASEAVITGLRAGRSHVDDLTHSDIELLLSRGFTPLLSSEPIPSVDVFLICVPTPLSADGVPDLSFVHAAGRTIASVIQPGALVVLESTSYPGTTEDVLRPILEESGLRAGADFHLAFSPERIDPGRSSHSFAQTPKVVGGLTVACRDAAAGFYSRLVDVVVTTSGLREAEMAKLLENTYRHINIAFVNEMARFCHLLGIDVWDAIAAASTKPFGFQRFDPGPGVGGHCIPIDPNYLSHWVHEQTGEQFRFVHLAQEINAGMPAYLVSRIERMLADRGMPLRGARVLLLGVTYKPDIADDRETPARPLAALLKDAGAAVLVHDPLLPRWSPPGVDVTPVDDIHDALLGCDVAVLLQAHSSFELTAIAHAAPLLLDTRGVVSAESPTVERL
jgi:nucleotide sugar dehydrogenase